MDSMRRLGVGVVGCGLIAQVMHLPRLQELDNRFEITTLRDISPAILAAKLELLHFHACLVQDRAVRTSAADARQDLVVLQAIARAAAGAGPRGLGAQVGNT